MGEERKERNSCFDLLLKGRDWRAGPCCWMQIIITSDGEEGIDLPLFGELKQLGGQGRHRYLGTWVTRDPYLLHI